MDKKPYILAIDGRAASGKTTVAEKLAKDFQGSVIHMDDFFLPEELRTEGRYYMPGGNIHYERFQEEILPLLKSGELREYRRFSCEKMAFEEETVKLPNHQFYIVEGAYSTHPIFGYYFDRALFFNISAEEQKRRIIARDGEEGWKMFEQKWIPLEEEYFEKFGIEERCNYTLRENWKSKTLEGL